MVVRGAAAVGSVDEPVSLADRRKALWLLSSYDDPVWIVRGSAGREETKKISFDIRLADGRSLLDTPRLCATVREFAWWLRDPRYSRITSAKVHQSAVRHLLLITHALTFENIWSFAHVQPFDVDKLVENCRFGIDAVLHATERVETYLANGPSPRAFAAGPTEAPTLSLAAVLAECKLPANVMSPGVIKALARYEEGLPRTIRDVEDDSELRNLTVQALQRWLDPLQQLFEMRWRIEAETLSFSPFAAGAARVAAVKGVGAKRTPIPPPALALHLLEHSARWVFDRIDSPSIPTSTRAEINRTATACWILIAAFTARRAGEIRELKHGCLRGDATTGWWLNIYVEKTLKREEWIPVPGIVARAVQMLTDISATARENSGNDLLFQWSSRNGGTTTIDPSRHLDSFAEFVQVPLHRPKDGGARAWHWSPHQFRRFFAVLYFYRFEGASIEALSHHLRHFSLEMTKVYITKDPEVAALWTDVEWGYTAHVARTIVAGHRSVTGAAGERYKKAARRLLDVFRRKLQVVPPDFMERVASSLTLLIQRQKVVLTPKPWVTCSCPATREAASVAACRRAGPPEKAAVGPDFTRAGPTVCGGCAYAMLEASKAWFVTEELQRLEGAVAASGRGDTLFGLLEAARVVELSDLEEQLRNRAQPITSGIDKVVGA